MKRKRAKTVIAAALLCAVMVLCGALFGCSCSEETYAIGIEITPTVTTELKLDVGDTASLKASVETNNGSAYIGNVTWSSSDESVAIVTSGVISAVGAGTATISVAIPGTDLKKSCTVKVYEGSVFRVGIKDDVKSFGYYNPNTMSYEGLEVDIGALLGEALGYTTVEYVPLEPDDREEALNSNLVDCVIATFSVTGERAEEMNFSASYYTDYVLAMSCGGYTNCTTLKDLTDALIDLGDVCTVGTVSGTTAYDAFQNYFRFNDIDDTDALGNKVYANVEYGDYEEAEAALENGDVGLFVGDYSILSGYKTKKDVFLEDALEDQNYAVATKLDSELSESINALIEQWLSEEDGTIASLLEKWDLA